MELVKMKKLVDSFQFKFINLKKLTVSDDDFAYYIVTKDGAEVTNYPSYGMMNNAVIII